MLRTATQTVILPLASKSFLATRPDWLHMYVCTALGDNKNRCIAQIGNDFKSLYCLISSSQWSSFSPAINQLVNHQLSEELAFFAVPTAFPHMLAWSSTAFLLIANSRKKSVNGKPATAPRQLCSNRMHSNIPPTNVNSAQITLKSSHLQPFSRSATIVLCLTPIHITIILFTLYRCLPQTYASQGIITESEGGTHSISCTIAISSLSSSLPKNPKTVVVFFPYIPRRPRRFYHWSVQNCLPTSFEHQAHELHALSAHATHRQHSQRSLFCSVTWCSHSE